MESLFDGTSRLAQMALCVFGIAVMMTAGSAAYSGSAKLGPLVMVVAGGMALAAYVRDREDYGMWPAYATMGAVLVGVVVSLPLMMNASGMREITRDSKVAQDAIVPVRAALEQAAKTCVVDGPYQNCSAQSMAKTIVAGPAGIRAGRDCKEQSTTCISDDGPNGYRVEYLTRPVKSVGILRYEETRTFRHKVLSTVCRAMDPKADAGQVKAACGEGIVVVPAGG